MEINKIYNECCLETMRRMDDDSIDCILTDPPFFMPAVHYQSRISWGRCYGDLSILGEFFLNITKEFKRILKPSGHLLVYCNDQSYPVFYPVAYGMWEYTRALIWDKTRVGLGKIFRHQYEMILWASDKGAGVYNDCKLHTNVLKYAPTLSKNRKHPVEKPVDMLKELLTILTKENDIVYDAFVGGGSTIIAATQLKRSFVGSEINDKYCQLAKKRIQDEELKLSQLAV